MSTVISAVLVKELRERTGAGMMECKKALEVSGGDMERAIEELRKSGRAKADKKASRIAAEGSIVIAEEGNRAVMIEVNSETDFVAKDHNFLVFINALAKAALEANATESQIGAIQLADSGQTVEEARLGLVAKVGENVQIRRIAQSNPSAVTVGTYLHGNRIGVMVELDIDNKALARDIAMHIAASRPSVISPEDVAADIIAKEKEIFMAQSANSGKPPEIIEKMVIGRLQKFLDEISLVGQPFVKDPNVTIGALLKQHRAKVLAFHRFEVGEGIEKVTEDFKEAVMSQVQSS